MTNSNYYFQLYLWILSCFNIRSSLYNWWLLYPRYHCWIQGWQMATEWNIGQKTCMARINQLRKGRYGHWWIFWWRQVSSLLWLFFDNRFFSGLETEIWNFTNESNKVVSPILPNTNYYYGIGLYLVPFNFCTT